jgi:uncharacterized protein YuzE
MKIELDTQANALYLQLVDEIRDGEAAHTQEIEEGVYLDLDKGGRPLGLEFLHADDLQSYLRRHGGAIEITDRAFEVIPSWEQSELVLMAADEGEDEAVDQEGNMPPQTALSYGTVLRTLADQQRAIQDATRQSASIYADFLNSALSFYQQAMQQATQVAQSNLQRANQATQQSVQAASQAAQQTLQSASQAAQQSSQEVGRADQDPALGSRHRTR